MWEKPEIDRHLLGRFQINNEELSGDIIYNKERGTIFLNITKELHHECGHSFSSMPSISGKLDSGAIVTLHHAACVRNHIQNLAYQKLLPYPKQLCATYCGHTPLLYTLWTKQRRKSVQR